MNQIIEDYDSKFEELYGRSHMNISIREISSRDRSDFDTPTGQFLVEIYEVWEDDDVTYQSDTLTKNIEWAENYLKNWKNVHRVGWSTWIFDNLADAEHFRTIFCLSCQK